MIYCLSANRLIICKNTANEMIFNFLPKNQRLGADKLPNYYANYSSFSYTSTTKYLISTSLILSLFQK